MSATSTRVILQEAREIADELVDLLRGACSRIEVAGSIRRGVPLVGDIDLVAIARTEPVLDPMFHEPTGEVVDKLHEAMDALYLGGLVEKRLREGGHAHWGPTSKRASFRGLNVDVNAVSVDTFGFWLAVKTGPAPFAHALVMPQTAKFAVRRPGGQIVGFRHGLLPPGLFIPEKSGFQLWGPAGRIETPEEIDLFRAINLPYLPPDRRR